MEEPKNNAKEIKKRVFISLDGTGVVTDVMTLLIVVVYLSYSYSEYAD